MSAEVQLEQRRRQWFIVGRWQEFEGEGRANLLRTIAVGAFYVIQLLQFYVLTEKPGADLIAFHRQATWIAAAWVVLALAVLMCLRTRVFPASLKFISTAADLALLTSVAAIGGKAESPMVLGYFLIIALAAVRFNLPLVWLATLGSLLGYLGLVGLTDDKWFDANHQVPVHVQLVTLLSLGLTGVLVGQMIRRTRRMADEYSERLAAAQREGRA